MCLLCTGCIRVGRLCDWSGEEQVTETVVSHHSPLRMLKVYVVKEPGSKDFRDMFRKSLEQGPL